jgi:hypothetical protein
MTGFVPFDDWDEQLAAARGGGNADFTRKLRASSYLAPRRPEGIGLSLLSTQYGEWFLAAFTSEVQFAKWSYPHGGAEVVTFELLHGIVTDDVNLAGIVINPFGMSLILRPETLSAIENSATGMTHERVEHRGALILGAAKYPPVLASAFASALKSSGMEVFEAYILAARQEVRAKPYLLFLIDFDGDRKILFPRVAGAIHPHMKLGSNFELLKANSALLELARKTAAPVFVRNL